MNINTCILGSNLNSMMIAHLERNKKELVSVGALPSAIDSDRELSLIDLIFYEHFAHEHNFYELRKIRQFSNAQTKHILIDNCVIKQTASYFYNLLSFQSKTFGYFELDKIGARFNQVSFDHAFEGLSL